MYITSFAHRQDLLNIAERWFCGRPDPADGLKLTRILICDGFITGVTLESVSRLLLEIAYEQPFHFRRIGLKGDLREAICNCACDVTERALELFRLYRENPDYYYREAPINAVLCLDDNGELLGVYRMKRPKRIAEKANRRLANWIFRSVQKRARGMARRRAAESGIPLEYLLTPEDEMVKEFVKAEESIARSFREGGVEFDINSLTINDVGGMKILGDEARLARVEDYLSSHSGIRVVEKEYFGGNYRAISLILELEWDRENACRRYRDTRAWENYLNRGIPAETLRNGLEPMIGGAESTICIELILTTFPDFVESELGTGIHEERIIAQRDNKVYKGYIPLNVEFLLEYLFSVGFSPEVNVEPPPIKLWGRYLPDTLISHIRRLYHLPEYDFFY